MNHPVGLQLHAELWKRIAPPSPRVHNTVYYVHVPFLLISETLCLTPNSAFTTQLRGQRWASAAGG